MATASHIWLVSEGSTFESEQHVLCITAAPKKLDNTDTWQLAQ